METKVRSVKKTEENFEYINKYTLHEVDQIKYLGVILDNKLNWHSHIDYLQTKLSRAAGIMFKVRDHLSLKTRIMLYDSLAASYLRYSTPAWGNATSTSLSKLQAMQNKIIRYMTYSPTSANMNQLYKKLNILRIEDHFFCETARFMHSVYHNSMPPAFANTFQVIEHNYNTRTRQQNHFALPSLQTERGKRILGYSGIVVWGKVPEHFKIFSKNKFKYAIKKWVISDLIPT